MLDKPAGLKVHPGPGGGASVEDWFPLLSRRRSGPWLAHRLDADTAGCLVVALRRTALRAAQACFAEGRAGKTYWAVVRGAPPSRRGSVSVPLARREHRAGWRMEASPEGLPARTDYVVRGAATDFSWLELRLLSGRTHQARVHCASLGCPVVGDRIYGPGDIDGPGDRADGADQRLHLLARAIDLPLDPSVHATASPPAHMREALAECGFS